VNLIEAFHKLALSNVKFNSPVEFHWHLTRKASRSEAPGLIPRLINKIEFGSESKGFLATWLTLHIILLGNLAARLN